MSYLEARQYVTEHATGNLYRASVFAEDEMAESPREWGGNVSTLITFDRDYNSPNAVNSYPDSLIDAMSKWQHGDYYGGYSYVEADKIVRYVSAFLSDEIVLISGLERSGYGSELYSTNDNHSCGLAIVTRKAMDEAFPGGWTRFDVDMVVKNELSTYNQWARGEVYYYLMEKWDSVNHGWEVIDSCGGFFDEPDSVLGEALMNIKDMEFTVVDPSDLGDAELNE